MAKIKKVQILKVQVYGFRGFQNQRTFTFDEIGKNLYIGENGKGKSSIGEAIAWCVTGRNVEGNQKGLNLINENSKMAKVTLTFNDENGKIHEIQRKVSSSTSIKFDLLPITQEKLKEIIDTDIFLTVFNPLYYLSLDSNSARNTVYSVIPTILKSDIFSKMEDIERELLEKEKFDESDTNEYLKNRRKELAELEDDKKYLEGYIGKLSETITIPTKMEFDNTKVVELEKKLEKINLRKPELIDLSELIIKKADIEKQILEIKNENFQSESLVIELKGKKALLQQQLKNEEAKEYRPEDISNIEKKVISLRSDYKSEVLAHNHLVSEKEKLNSKKIAFNKGDTCPLCKQLVSEHSVENLNNELQKEVSAEKEIINKKQVEKRKTLAELEQEGKDLLEKISIAKKADEEAKAKFEKLKKETISKIKTEIKEIQDKLDNMDKLKEAFDKKKEENIKPLLAQIEALGITDILTKNKAIQDKFDKEISKEKSTIQASLTELKKEKEVVFKNETYRNNVLKTIEENNKMLTIKNKEMIEIGQKEIQINLLISSMKSFNAKKTTILDTVISKHLKDVSLNLFKVIESTGEVKDVFDILYCGKSLKVCSTSEVIKAGLEISNMIRDLSGCTFPVFIDNGESITEYDEPSTQIIETRVVKGSNLSCIKKDGTTKEVTAEPIPKEKSGRNRFAVDRRPAKVEEEEIDEIA